MNSNQQAADQFRLQARQTREQAAKREAEAKKLRKQWQAYDRQADALLALG